MNPGSAAINYLISNPEILGETALNGLRYNIATNLLCMINLIPVSIYIASSRYT